MGEQQPPKGSSTCRQQWMSAQVGCQLGTKRGVSTHLEFPGGVHHPLMGCVSTLRQSADGAARTNVS